MKKVDIETLGELLSYCPLTGKITWRQRGLKWFDNSTNQKRWNTRYSNQTAGTTTQEYCQIRVLGTRHQAHRIAWAIYYGKWPCGLIDHINGNKIDNRINNLRDVDTQENSKNTKRPTNNTSGHLGVSWSKSRSKWYANIKVNGFNIFLGYAENKEAAVVSRKAAEKKYGFHENHGR